MCHLFGPKDDLRAVQKPAFEVFLHVEYADSRELDSVS
jgi:hypothetical protein